jgi:hypothetical protein
LWWWCRGVRQGEVGCWKYKRKRFHPHRSFQSPRNTQEATDAESRKSLCLARCQTDCETTTQSQMMALKQIPMNQYRFEHLSLNGGVNIRNGFTFRKNQFECQSAWSLLLVMVQGRFCSGTVPVRNRLRLSSGTRSAS